MDKKYNVVTSFPATESGTDQKSTKTRQTTTEKGVNAPDVADLFNSYLEADYKVSTSFDSSDSKVAKDDSEQSPFAVGKALSKNGIEYQATLKITDKGAYEDMHKAMQLVSANGYDMTVNVQLKENDKTAIDLDRPDTWTGSDSIVKVNPKAKSGEVAELKELYDELIKAGYATEITIKPKLPKENTDVDIKQTFMTQLLAYPEDTTVKFRLSQKEEKQD